MVTQFTLGSPASMGPPREHGGMLTEMRRELTELKQLQWGRRVNTAEWMVPAVFTAVHGRLQWGRRVNTAE